MTKYNKKYFTLFSLAVFFSVCLAAKTYAAFVSPTKVFIDEGRTSASISISNTNDKTTVYTFEWERRARSKDGKNTILLKEGETLEGYRPADPYLIFSPRKVVVEPGETQRVRIFARRPKDMEPGEYRSHLKITSDEVAPEETAAAPKGSFAGVLAIRSALSIPIMLRTGKTSIDIKVTDPKIVEEGAVDVLHLHFLNESTRSIYGYGVFECKTAESEKAVVHKSNGFRLYQETKNSAERFVVPNDLQRPKCVSLDFKLYADRDPEYRTPIATVKLK